MAIEVSQRIMDMVRRELVENPDVDNAELYDRARRTDPAAMKDVDRRQFNARYPLKVKRFEMKARKPKPPAADTKPRRRKRGVAGVPQPAAAAAAAPMSVFRQMARESVRDVLLRFAQDLANAETRGDIVGVVAGVDQYVDQVLGLGTFPE